VVSGPATSGERVEVAGDLRSTGSELVLSVAYMSAMPPLRVETGALNSEESAKIHARCAGPFGRPACQAKVRGEVIVVEGRSRLLAHHIELEESRR